MLKRVRDFATVQGDGTIDEETAIAARKWMDIDELGLDELDRSVLRAIIEMYGGGPVGLDTLAAALGANVAWDPTGNAVVITAGSGPITSGDLAYQSDVVYWLSHIINAESGNQPLAGKIAVGNVVLNRVASSLFPDTVYEVIHQRNQFTPVTNGSINLTPNTESVAAAKLCLDGANTIGNALYFINPRSAPNSWAARNRSYVATIGAHAFFA